MVVVLWRLPKTNTSKCEEFKSNYVFRQVNAFLSFSSVFLEMVFFSYILFPEPSLILTSHPQTIELSPLAFHQQSGFFKCYQNALQWKGRSFIFKEDGPKVCSNLTILGYPFTAVLRSYLLSVHCPSPPPLTMATPILLHQLPSFFLSHLFSHFVHTSQVYINKLVFHRHHWPFSFHQSRYGGLQCFSVMFVKASW